MTTLSMAVSKDEGDVLSDVGYIFAINSTVSNFNQVCGIFGLKLHCEPGDLFFAGYDYDTYARCNFNLSAMVVSLVTGDGTFVVSRTVGELLSYKNYDYYAQDLRMGETPSDATATLILGVFKEFCEELVTSLQSLANSFSASGSLDFSPNMLKFN